MRRTSSLASAIVLAIAALASPAAADREVSIAFGPQFAPSPSVDAVTADRGFPVGALGVGVDLPGVRPLGLALQLEGHAELAGTGGTAFQHIDTSLSLASFRVGAALRHRFGDRLAAFGRLAVGYTTGSIALEDRDGGSRRLTDRAHGASALTGAGLDIALGATASGRLRVGLRAELDYTYYSPLSFAAAPDSTDDSLALDTAAVSLGDLHPSGLGFRVGLVGRF